MVGVRDLGELGTPDLIENSRPNLRSPDLREELAVTADRHEGQVFFCDSIIAGHKEFIEDPIAGSTFRWRGHILDEAIAGKFFLAVLHRLRLGTGSPDDRLIFVRKLDILGSAAWKVAHEAGELFHTYSTYSRGVDMLNGAYHYLDLVPKGRDESGLNHTMGWVRRHDQYDR